MKIETFEKKVIFNDTITTNVILETPFSKEIRILLKCGQIMKEHKKSFVEFDGVIQPNPAPRFSSSNNEIRHAPVKAGQNNDEICEQFDLDRSCFK